MGRGGLEGNGGGTAAVGTDDVRGGARVVVALAHLVHGVASSVVEHEAVADQEGLAARPSGVVRPHHPTPRVTHRVNRRQTW